MQIKHGREFMRPGVYVMTCEVSNQCYVGSTKNLARRMSHHRQFLRRGEHGNQRVQAAYDKYGESAFKIYVECFCEEHELYKKEQEVFNEKAKTYTMFNKGLLVDNPLLGSTRPDAERCRQQVLSAQDIAREAFRQKLKSDPEFRARAVQRGKDAMAKLRQREDVEIKRKAAARAASRTPEARAKRSALMKEQWARGVHKPPVCAGANKRKVVNTETGIVYESLTAAATALGLSLATVHRWIQGRKHGGVYKKPANKYMWQWYEEANV